MQRPRFPRPPTQPPPLQIQGNSRYGGATGITHSSPFRLPPAFIKGSVLLPLTLTLLCSNTAHLRASRLVPSGQLWKVAEERTLPLSPAMHLPVILFCAALWSAVSAETSDDYELMYVNLDNEIDNGLHPTEDRKFILTVSLLTLTTSPPLWV